jgi:hypothetical protein
MLSCLSVPPLLSQSSLHPLSHPNQSQVPLSCLWPTSVASSSWCSLPHPLSPLMLLLAMYYVPFLICFLFACLSLSVSTFPFLVCLGCPDVITGPTRSFWLLFDLYVFGLYRLSTMYCFMYISQGNSIGVPHLDYRLQFYLELLLSLLPQSSPWAHQRPPS